MVVLANDDDDDDECRSVDNRCDNDNQERRHQQQQEQQQQQYYDVNAVTHGNDTLPTIQIFVYHFFDIYFYFEGCESRGIVQSCQGGADSHGTQAA